MRLMRKGLRDPGTKAQNHCMILTFLYFAQLLSLSAIVFPPLAYCLSMRAVTDGSRRLFYSAHRLLSNLHGRIAQRLKLWECSFQSPISIDDRHRLIRMKSRRKLRVAW